jgi:signal peptidase I
VNPATVASRPKPSVAGFLSVLALGLGHLYAGRWKRALGVWFGARATEFLLVVLMSIVPDSRILPIAGLGSLALTIAVAWDAIRCARRADTVFIPQRYNRWFVYAAAFALNLLVLQPQFGKLLGMRLQLFKVTSAAMQPTLLPGDRLVATRIARGPPRQEVVIYRNHGLDLIKRVVGLPGDTLAMQAGTLLVDGRTVSEPYAIRVSQDETESPDFLWQTRYLASGESPARYRPTQATWGPLVVPPGAYFVLGDNRDDSFDSRYSGFVPADSIRKRARVLYFSLDPDTKLPRWGRIGRSIQ